MGRIYNFCAGPSMLPEPVLMQAQAEMLNWHNTGMSITEISHRSKDFEEIVTQSELDLRGLLAIPDNYKVLFIAGGATNQFAMVPLNLFSRQNINADYIDTGLWSKKAIDEAKRYGNITIAAEIATKKPFQIPSQDTWILNSKAAYVHYTPNETIDGIEFHWVPDMGQVPLVADMSSTLLSRPIDVSKFGLIYAGTQKNLGPSGLTVVIIREDLIDETLPKTPTLYQYLTYDKNKSLYNTPPTFNWYLTGLVFSWVKQQGGLQAMAEINQRKANMLYEYIDSTEFYQNYVHPSCRSWMNIPFSIVNSAQNELFLTLAQEAGLANLAGHRTVGGMRASIYNAMPEAGVIALIHFMQDFMQRHG